MKLELLAVKDTQTGLFTMPFTMRTKREAIRGAKTMANQEKPNNLNTYMEDKQLWSLGKYNEETGEIKSKVELIVNIIELVDTKKVRKEDIINGKKNI